MAFAAANDPRAGLKPTVRVIVLEPHIQEITMQQKVTAQIGANQISIETGKIARLADGAVVVTCGDTMVLASAVSATAIKEGQDYFPLTVDYREKAAAVGKFPGGYFKREGRPAERKRSRRA